MKESAKIHFFTFEKYVHLREIIKIGIRILMRYKSVIYIAIILTLSLLSGKVQAQTEEDKGERRHIDSAMAI